MSPGSAGSDLRSIKGHGCLRSLDIVLLWVYFCTVRSRALLPRSGRCAYIPVSSPSDSAGERWPADDDILLVANRSKADALVAGYPANILPHVLPVPHGTTRACH